MNPLLAKLIATAAAGLGGAFLLKLMLDDINLLLATKQELAVRVVGTHLVAACGGILLARILQKG